MSLAGNVFHSSLGDGAETPLLRGALATIRLRTKCSLFGVWTPLTPRCTGRAVTALATET
jgi:hypothetical protein